MVSAAATLQLPPALPPINPFGGDSQDDIAAALALIRTGSNMSLPDTKGHSIEIHPKDVKDTSIPLPSWPPRPTMTFLQPPTPKLPQGPESPEPTDYVNVLRFESAYQDDADVIVNKLDTKGKGKAKDPIEDDALDYETIEDEPTGYARLPDDDEPEHEMEQLRLGAFSPTSPVLLTPASTVNGSSRAGMPSQPQLHVDTGLSPTVSELSAMFPETPATTIEEVLRRVGEQHREEAVDALIKLEHDRQGASSSSKSPFSDPADAATSSTPRQPASTFSTTPSSPSSPTSPRVRFHESTQPSSPNGTTAAGYNSAAKGIRVLASKFPDMDRATLAAVLASCGGEVGDAERAIRQEKMVDTSEDGASQTASMYLAMNPPGPQEDGLAVLSGLFPNIKVSWLEGVLDSTYGNVPAAAQLISVYEEERVRGSLPRRKAGGTAVSSYLANREKKEKEREKKEGSKWKLFGGKKDSAKSKRMSVPAPVPFTGSKDSDKGGKQTPPATTSISSPPVPPNPEVRSEAIDNLSAMFPDFDQQAIGGILDSVNGRVDQALEILLRNQAEEEQRQGNASAAPTPPRQRKEHAEV